MLRAFITIFVWAAGIYVLSRFEYLIAFSDIDNIVGMIPFALVLIGAAGTTALLWIKHTKHLAPVSAVLLLLVVLSIVLFPTALRGNWWYEPTG